MDATLLRRPNGRPQACDPCRARKVACDHEQPICNRCRKRGQDNECVYTGSVPRFKTARRQLPSRQQSPVRTTPTSSGPSVVIVGGSAMSPGLPTSPPSRTGSGTGYLGFTSHSAVFEETRQSLSLLHGPISEQVETSTADRRTEESVCFRDLPPTLRTACIYVLEHLPGQANEHTFFTDNADTTCEGEGWTHVAVAHIVRSLQTTFGAQLKRGGSELERIAETICYNTTRPLQDIHTGPMEWMEQFCSPDTLRWESFGLVWTDLERISDAIGGLRKGHLAWLPGKQSSDTALNCLVYCIDIARHLNQGNDLTLDLLRRRSVLESIMMGDASLTCWNSHALTVSLLTYLGAHVQQDVQPYKPSLCSENKRRLFAQVFNSDKFSVSFTGRPPFISRRYCSTPLPLDLPDEILTANEETLMNAVKRLDHRGWNTDGGLYPTTLVRARFMITVILDELIEISLDRIRPVAVSHLQYLKARQLTIMAEFPPTLVYDPDNIFDPSLPIESLYARILIHLGHLQNLFFIERLLIRHGAPDDGNLLLTSFNMVKVTLVFWTHKDQFANIRRHFEWLLMAYGAPGGGILCQELLQPSFSGTHPLDARLSRSGIIQQLSLLVGFLDWVRPSAPNAELCADCKAIIQRVLDHHLNAPIDGEGDVQVLDWDFTNRLDFNFELLDTFDWVRADQDWPSLF
ncbi:hypothetical protein BGZ63DRAFT_397322 [Mariannaea sp. PMI_226]|nr:hypothetical protein BGZ63DRAFT_397322 [Mariannaea sp. PMI_226]